jgi:hypothetical protein
MVKELSNALQLPALSFELLRPTPIASSSSSSSSSSVSRVLPCGLSVPGKPIDLAELVVNMEGMTLEGLLQQLEELKEELHRVRSRLNEEYQRLRVEMIAEWKADLNLRGLKTTKDMVPALHPDDTYRYYSFMHAFSVTMDALDQLLDIVEKGAAAKEFQHTWWGFIMFKK